MSKYIDVDLLRKDINRWEEAMADAVGEYSDGVRFALKHFAFILDSLQQEQPEVDLKKEIDDELDRNWRGYYIEYRRFAESAKHFYELGLNARKQ